MEKEWEDFWITGRVGDYLNYKNCYYGESKSVEVKTVEGKQKETEEQLVSWDRELR